MSNSLSKITRSIQKHWLLATTLTLCALAAAGNCWAQAAPADNAPAQTAPAARSKTIEQEKRELHLMLQTSAIILGGFFMAVFLFTMIRMGRRYRWWAQRGAKREPTEYVEAWSNYRLPDEDNQSSKDDS